LTELVVKGGTVYGPDGPLEADVHVSDGVIMGASVVRRFMEGGADAAGAFMAEVRAALDSA